MKTSRLWAILIGTGISISAPTAHAEQFSYVDRNGVVHQVSVDPAELTTLVESSPTPQPPPLVGGTPGSDFDGFPYADLVREAARLNSLPVELLRAVMYIESGFNPQAVSSAGALGLMQLMPATAGDMGVSDSFDPRQNVFGGARLLRILVNSFDGSVPLALAAYHAGATTIRRSGGIPPSKVTRKYVADVLAVYHRLMAKTLAARSEGRP